MKLNHLHRSSGRLLASTTLLVLSSGLSVLADYQSSILDQSPSGYWRLSETSPTSIPNTNAVNAGTLGSAENGTYSGDQTFVNGVLLASGNPTSYVPGTAGVFSIGARSDGNATFPWAGKADEVAFYNTVLTPSQIAAHYAAATTNAAGYAAQISALNPLVYYR